MGECRRNATRRLTSRDRRISGSNTKSISTQLNPCVWSRVNGIRVSQAARSTSVGCVHPPHPSLPRTRLTIRCSLSLHSTSSGGRLFKRPLDPCSPIGDTASATARRKSMIAKIYQPARSAMQSGQANTRSWVLEFLPADAKVIDPLMGWTGSRDMNQQVRLSVSTAARRRSPTPSGMGSPSRYSSRRSAGTSCGRTAMATTSPQIVAARGRARAQGPGG